MGSADERQHKDGRRVVSVVRRAGVTTSAVLWQWDELSAGRSERVIARIPWLCVNVWCGHTCFRLRQHECNSLAHHTAQRTTQQHERDADLAELRLLYDQKQRRLSAMRAFHPDCSSSESGRN